MKERTCTWCGCVESARNETACPAPDGDGHIFASNVRFASDVRAALTTEVAKAATSRAGQAWIPIQLSMEDNDDDWRPF